MHSSHLVNLLGILVNTQTFGHLAAVVTDVLVVFTKLLWTKKQHTYICSRSFALYRLLREKAETAHYDWTQNCESSESEWK